MKTRTIPKINPMTSLIVLFLVFACTPTADQGIKGSETSAWSGMRNGPY